jgi:hypothetical protein
MHQETETMSTSTFHPGFQGFERRRLAVPIVLAAAAVAAISLGAASGPIQAVLAGTSRCVPGMGQACGQAVPRQIGVTAPAPLGRPLIISVPQATSPISAADKANLAALRARFAAAMGLSASR